MVKGLNTAGTNHVFKLGSTAILDHLTKENTKFFYAFDQHLAIIHPNNKEKRKKRGKHHVLDD